MTWLLDGNALVALVLKEHTHHERARGWFGRGVERFGTCVVTQGTLLRVHMAVAVERSASAAWETLRKICSHPRHEFWSDGFGYAEVGHAHLQAPKQVTDAWLAELARRRGGRLATFDASLVALYPDAAYLIP